MENIQLLHRTGHNSVVAEAMYVLAYPVGRESVWNHMNKIFTDASAPLAHMRLTGLDGSFGPYHSSGTTWWCFLGDNWVNEFNTFLDTPTVPVGNRYAQIAYYASNNAEMC